MTLLPAFILFATAVLATKQIPIVKSPNGPNEGSARASAPQIFNALHSSMRQWGSSLNHNGMSFFPATIPARTSFYHGTDTTEPETGLEWLAFEIEHAELFARGRRGRPGRRPGQDPPANASSRSKEYVESSSDGRPDGDVRGALHHYRTSRDLKVLYLDGMSAGKTSMGTMDQQRYVMCNVSAGDMQDVERNAPPSCPTQDRGLALYMRQEFGHVVDGIVRMEAGFELILFNFTSGVDFISATPRPPQDTPVYLSKEIRNFEYIRGISYRYHGITAGRVKIDHSNMISAYFYNINLTNPDPAHPSLPRLSSGKPTILKDIRSEVMKVLANPSQALSIDWQGVVDLIVTRYSDRLRLLALPGTSHSTFQKELNFLLNMFIDYSDLDIFTSRSRCMSHYLSGLPLSTDTDHLLYAAVSTVTSTICSALFSVRSSLLDSNSTATVKAAKRKINDLTSYLAWTTWLECGKCAYDEVCFVAVWPMGGVMEHEQPSCVPKDEVSSKKGYWEGGPGGGRGPLDRDHPMSRSAF